MTETHRHTHSTRTLGMISMKVHQLARAVWSESHELPSLSLGCKRLRPLAPKLQPTSSFDLKSFIRPDTQPHDDKKSKIPLQVETQPGGTRWNPTQEQIGILESLYRGGMRTPNAQQIEHITGQLSKFGKIEGKNVFYWFQNHKARERQKQKRNNLGLAAHSARSSHSHAHISIALNPGGGVEREREASVSPYKRKCMSWGSECFNNTNSKNENITSSVISGNCNRDELAGSRTLELFPLHPEGR